MSLMTRDPFQNVRALARRMEQAFEPLISQANVFDRETMSLETWPPVDIYEDREEIVLRADVPGMDQKEVEILLEDGTLTLRGERKMYREDRKENLRRVETNIGQFTRSFTMPSTIDRDKVRAEMRNGVLEVHIPKKEGAKARSIPVNA